MSVPATQKMKVVQLVPPGVIKDNASYSQKNVDTKGWDYATIVFQLGATDIAMAALRVRESDSTASTGMSNISGLNFGSTSNTGIDGSVAALPGSTHDNEFYGCDIDLRQRKRYLDCKATAGDGTAGTYMSALAILTRGEQAPNTASERGFTQILRT